MRQWSIAADDRTGALEVGGELVPAFGPVSVAGWGLRSPRPGSPVVDLGSRHLPAATAGERAAAVERAGAAWSAHKIDSTLRGNWAVELVARHRVAGRRVLLVPAWPALGRSCTGGVVEAHGTPVAAGSAAADPLRPVSSSRAADHLEAAGARVVTELAGAAELGIWLRAGGEFAVCDAATEAELAEVAGRWAEHAPGVLFAGPAGAIGAAARAIAHREGSPIVTPTMPEVARPIVVACGSLHPMARAQIARLRDDMPEVAVVASAPADGSVDDVAAIQAARALAAAVCEGVTGLHARTLVIIGGDTAAAVMGDTAWVVGGTLAPGVPWSRRADASGPMVVTKAGGFGHVDTLVDLLAERGAAR